MPSLIGILYCVFQSLPLILFLDTALKGRIIPLSSLLILRVFANFLYINQVTLSCFNDVLVYSLVWLGRNHLFSMTIVARAVGRAMKLCQTLIKHLLCTGYGYKYIL